MDLQIFLIESLQKRFSANATVNAIEDEIVKIAEKNIFNKYKDDTLFIDGLEFELGGVNGHLEHWKDSLTLDEVVLDLVYFCTSTSTSKLPKAKRERLKEVKEKYKQTKDIEWSNHKIPAWRTLRYMIDIESVLSGNFNLKIEV